jgi:hypothetical protein
VAQHSHRLLPQASRWKRAYGSLHKVYGSLQRGYASLQRAGSWLFIESRRDYGSFIENRRDYGSFTENRRDYGSFLQRTVEVTALYREQESLQLEHHIPDH